MSTTMDDVLARLPKDERISLSTRFADEPYERGSYFAKDGEASSVLGTLTEPLWHDYVYRRGHAWARNIPPENPTWLGEHGTTIYTLDDGWATYRVYLASDTTNTPLDLDKTLGALGLTERHVWVRFERAE